MIKITIKNLLMLIKNWEQNKANHFFLMKYETTLDFFMNHQQSFSH